jgi:ankyrin repeat protein
LLKRDFEGNTALHSAAKAGNFKILEWLCGSVTRGFLEI